jgi:hypothetical protein
MRDHGRGLGQTRRNQDLDGRPAELSAADCAPHPGERRQGQGAQDGNLPAGRVGEPDRVFEPKPIACARWVARGPIIDQTHVLAFTFENGKIADTFDPTYVNPAMGALSAALLNAATCGKLSYAPFPELMKGK